MTWGKMDDKFHRNQKVRSLRRVKGGREALGVWVFWWSWCLDDPELTGVVPGYELDATEKKAAALLVETGLWDEVDGGYRFHDFHEYNPRREQLDAKREADRQRIAEKRAASRANVARDNQATRNEQDSESHGSPPRVAATRDPDPTRPDPTLSLPTTASERAGASAEDTRSDGREVRQVFKLWSECWASVHGDPPMLVESAHWQRAFEIVKLVRGFEEANPRFNREKFYRLTMTAAARDTFVARAANPFAAYASTPDGALRKADVAEADKREASGWA